MTREQAVAKLEEFALLQKDWDSYGAEPVSPVAIAGARAILEHRMTNPFPACTPTPEGGVCLFWEGSPYMEVEITPSGDMEYFASAETPDGVRYIHFGFPGKVQS